MPIYTPSAVGDHCVAVHTGNGHGSTATKIRRFTTVLTNVGSAIAHTDSAANGASFTALVRGFYEMAYGDCNVSGGNYHGITRNSAQLTTDIFSVTTASRVGYIQSVNGNCPLTLTRVELLEVGDVIRPHTTGTQETAASTYNFFSIRLIGRA